MIGEQICIRRVGLFILLVTLVCSWDVVCFPETAKEVTTSYLVDLASLDIDEDTAQMLWANCRAEMVRVKDTVEELELDACIPHQGPDSFNYKCKSEEKEKIRQFLSLLYPELKQTLIDCLRKNGLPFRVSGEEDGYSNWFTSYIERLSSTLAIHQRSLESPPGVAEGPEPSPAFRDVSEATIPPSPTSRDVSEVTSSNKGDDNDKIVIAVVVTACVTFLFALVLFIIVYKLCISPSPQTGPNDDKPLLGQSTSFSCSGSPDTGFVYGTPFKEENLNSQSPDHKPKVSSLDGSGAIEADALRQSFGRPSVGAYAGGLKVELQNYRLSHEGSSKPLKQPPGRVGSSLRPPLGRSPSVLNAPPGSTPSMKPPPMRNPSVLKPPPARNPSVLKPPPARNPSVLKPPPARNPSVLKPPPARADPLPHEPPAPPKLPSTVAAPPPPPPPALRPATGPPPPPGSGGPRPPGPPPPPPPGPGGRAPGPPPPPPPKGGGGGAGPRAPPPPLGRGGRPPPLAPMGAGGAEDEGPKAKLKPFFWDKVLANPRQSMVWHQIKGGSFQFNEEMIETLFGYNAVDKAKKETKKETPAQESTSTVVQLIDAKKAQNLSILLRALNVTIEEVRDALIEGNELPVEFLQTVLKMAPNTDEELKLRLYDGELSQLGPADRFLKVMVNIPFAFKRMDALLFMSSLQEELAFVKDSFSTLEVACQELRNNRVFLKLLEAVLKTGNRMNSGTFRGGAQAFKLDTLLKLSDVKGTDAKTTLLHFVVQEIVRSEGIRAFRVAKESNIVSIEQSGAEDEEEHYRNLGLQVVSAVGGELGNVKKAAIIDADSVTGAVARLGFSLVKAQDLLNTDLKNLEEDSDFHQVLKSFVQNAQTEISGLMEEEKRILGMVKRTVDYFHGNSAKDEGLKLFIIVRDFLVMLDKACREVKDAPPMRPSKPVKKKEGGPNLAPSGSDSSLASPASSDLRKRLFPAIQDLRQSDSSSSDEDS